MRYGPRGLKSSSRSFPEKRNVMVPRRVSAALVCVIGFCAACSAAQAGAAPSLILKFVDNHITVTSLGFAPNPASSPPVGSTVIFRGRLYNDGVQFGKANGAAVGRVVLDCTVLSDPVDGYCAGIVHLPDGFFIIAGNGPLTLVPVHRYAVTGGIGPHATARGEFTVTNGANGESVSEAVLAS